MMSRYQVNSFAYDYDMFLPKTEKPSNIVELDRRKDTDVVKQPRRAAARAVSIPMIMMIVLMLGLVLGNIFLRVRITEVTSTISKCDTQLDRAISENTSLEMRIENAVSLKNLEQSAQELGMQKAERYQINYIDAVDSDKTEVLKGGSLLTAAAE